MTRSVLSLARSQACVRTMIRARTLWGLSSSATRRVWSAQKTRGQSSKMSPWDRGTDCPGVSSARRASVVLYMNLLAGETVWQPRRVNQTGTSDFRARSGQRHGGEHHLVLDEGAWGAPVLTPDRGAGLRVPLGCSREVRPQ